MIEIRINRQVVRSLRTVTWFVLALALLAGIWGNAQTAWAEPPWSAPPVGTRVQLPVLSFVGADATSRTVIQVQNVGSDFTRAILVVWGEAGPCGPQSIGPFKIECSGLIKPGATWIFSGQDGQVPAGAKSGIVYTFPNVDVVNEDGDLVNVADEFCERLFSEVTYNADEWRRFDIAFAEGANFFGIPPTGGQPVAVDVVRVSQGTPSPDLTVSGAYSGLTGIEVGEFDPVFGGFAYYAPIVYADAGGLTSWLYIQNSGIDSTGVELWFQDQNDCLRATIVEVLCVAPGETAQYNVANAVGPSFVGSVWIRTSQPSGVVVDHVGQNVLMTDKGVAAKNAAFQSGSEVLFGPLIYREFQGWETSVTVQNLSGVQYGAVKVYFYDESGNIITTLVDYICPRGTQTFFLPVINGLPGQYVGAVRVESLTIYQNAGGDVQYVPIAGVAHLKKHSDPTTTQIQEAISYNLFGESQTFDWQIGPGQAGLIGVPSVLKQGRGLSTELAIQNVNPNPGFTDFAIYIYDPNGLLEVVCEKLSQYNVEYINFNSWGLLNPGFVGSVVISGTYTNQPGGFGLSAVAIQRLQSILQFNAPGDESSGHEAFPIFTQNFDFEGFTPQCPGQPSGPCTYALSGQVIESLDLRPIDGATITAVTGVYTRTTTTDSTGNYFLEVPGDKGEVTITVEHPAHVPQTVTRERRSCGETMQQNFELEPLEALIHISGVVEEKITGDPIAGATVQAVNDVDSVMTTTELDGSYTLTLDFDPEHTTTVIASIDGYNPSADSVFIPKNDSARIDFQLHQTPKSRVLLYYGNGGVGPDDEAGPDTDYFRLQDFYESLGFIVDYTDVFPRSADWTSYKLVVLLGPGHDSGDSLPQDEFTIGQKADLDNFLQQGGHLVVLSDHTGFTGQAVENDLLADLPIDLAFNSNSWSDGLGDQITDDCLTNDVGTIDADQWTDVTSPNGTAVPGALVLQNASANPATNCPNCAIIFSDVPSHGAGRVTIVGDMNFGDDATNLNDFNWSANNEEFLFNMVACDF